MRAVWRNRRRRRMRCRRVHVYVRIVCVAIKPWGATINWSHMCVENIQYILKSMIVLITPIVITVCLNSHPNPGIHTQIQEFTPKSRNSHPNQEFLLDLHPWIPGWESKVDQFILNFLNVLNSLNFLNCLKYFHAFNIAIVFTRKCNECMVLGVYYRILVLNSWMWVLIRWFGV